MYIHEIVPHKARTLRRNTNQKESIRWGWPVDKNLAHAHECTKFQQI